MAEPIVLSSPAARSCRSVILEDVILVSPTVGGAARLVVGRLHRDGFFFEPTETSRRGAAGSQPPRVCHLLFPGLVNGHDHLHLNVFPRTRLRPRYENSTDWAADMAAHLETPAFRRLRAVPEAQRAWHGGVKNALAGTTGVVHHDPALPVFDDADFPVTVAAPVGWAHSLDLGEGPPEGLRYGPDVASSYAVCPPDQPWFIHLAEGLGEPAGREIDRLEATGALGANTRLVHGVGLSPGGARKARRAGAALIWCPSANEFLLGQVADPGPFLPDACALGTDSRLTGLRDLLDELRIAAAYVTPETLLTLTTAVAPRLCNLEMQDGSAGAPLRDFFLLRVDAASGLSPARSLVGARRADLRLVVSRGHAFVADRDLAWAFDGGDGDALAASLDGVPKVISRRMLGPVTTEGLEEPGLELAASPQRRRPASARASLHGPMRIAGGTGR